MLGDGKFHGSMEENRAQCNNNRLDELQLIGHVPIQPSGETAIDIRNYECRPIKRVREEEPPVYMPPQNLGISFDYNIGSRLNPNPVPTGLRLFVDKKERSSSANSAIENSKNVLPSVLSLGNNSSIKMLMDRQTEEFCQFMKHQGENILKGGRELNQRHTTSLLNTLENSFHKKMREKELQIEGINLKNKELEDRVKQVTMEAQSWYNIAKYNESVSNVLKTNIQQIMAQGHEGYGDSNEVDDADSCKNLRGIVVGCRNQELENQRLRCRGCKNRQVSVLLFPCRHLCLCSDCDGVLEVCPVCGVTKTGSFLVCM